MNSPANDNVTIRKGDAADVDAAARVLAAAFTNYPWITYTVAADGREQRLFQLYRTILGDLVIPYGRLWVAETAPHRPPGPASVVGAAGWFTPETQPPEAAAHDVAQCVWELRGDRATQAAAAEAAIAANAADYPHWYLGAIGVAPATQGRGIGAMLLRPALELADQQREPVRLETSSERNVAFYARHGFGTVSELAIPGGPRCRLMERLPRSIGHRTSGTPARRRG